MAPVSAHVAAQRLGFPLIVKPNGQGSTVGLTLVRTPPELDAALELAAASTRKSCSSATSTAASSRSAFSTTQPLAVGEIIPATGPIFDYAAKYQAGGAEEIFPADSERRANGAQPGSRVARASGAEARRLQPRRFPHGRGRRLLVPRGQHAAGLDGGEPAAARGRGRRHRLRRALRAHLPRRARRSSVRSSRAACALRRRERRSSSARSSAESASASAAWLSRTCASLEAFGITMTSGCRSSHASAMRAGVTPSRAAMPSRPDACAAGASRCRAANTPSAACRACGTTAEDPIRRRAARGCTAPDSSRSSAPPGSARASSRSATSKLLTP